jgi:hypothetical protein
MNAISKVGARVKFVAVLITAVFVVAVGLTMIKASLAEPRIEISFSHYTTNQNARYAIVDVRNTGGAPAQYRGYSKENPAADLVFRDVAGEWQSRILRCGTGLIECRLMPGEQVRTTNYVYGVGEWKMGLHYYKPRFMDGLRVRALLAFVPQRSAYQTTWSAVHKGFERELLTEVVEDIAAAH